MNTIRMIGGIKERFNYLYEFEGERFYSSYIECKRSSGVLDTLPLVVSENAVILRDFAAGDIVEVHGQVRTRNEKSKVRVFIFAQDMIKAELEDVNEVRVKGCLCKKPTYRTTPLGREISDMIVAVNRRHGSDYIPCIAWGRNARKSSRFTVGEIVEIVGRLQSRDYGKGVAYELSISEISAARDDK